MIQSMTGFGSAEGPLGRGRVTVEVRTVNHRFFNPSLKLPTRLQRWEGDVREAATLARAIEGVDTVVSAVHGFAGSGGVTPASVDRDGNAHLIEAAATIDGWARTLERISVGASPSMNITAAALFAATTAASISRSLIVERRRLIES